MRICYKAGNVTYNTNYYSVITDSVEIRIWFLTDEIIRIRAGFDGDWDEASYSLAMTAWDSRTDEFLKDLEKVEKQYEEISQELNGRCGRIPSGTEFCRR